MVSVKRGHLTVLGSGGDGKTSFIDRLTGRGFNKAHIVTDGIEAELSCTVDIVNCTEAWTQRRMDQAQVLQEAVTTGFSQLLNEFQHLEVEISQSHEQNNKPQPKMVTGNIDIGIDSEENGYESNEYSSHSVVHKSDKQLDSKPDAETTKELEQVYMHSKTSDMRTKQDQSDVKITDFGGQWMYKTIHHVFVRNKCVFALVINLSIKLNSLTTVETKPKLHTTDRSLLKRLQAIFSRSQKIGKVKYIDQIIMWLNTILTQMRPNEQGIYPANTFIIGTHKDKLDKKESSRSLKAKAYFEVLRESLISKTHKQMIRGYYAIDNKHGDPEIFTEIRQEIMKAIEENCDWNQERPIKWLQMEKHLHDLQKEKDVEDKLDKNLIPFKDVCKYGEKFQIHKNDIEAFCNFHHMRGDITYLHTEALRGYIIANPQWLVNVFRAIITLPMYRPTHRPELQDEIHLLEHDGILKTKGAFLKYVWKEFLEGKEESQQRIEYLVQLLVHFDITCPLKEGSTTEDGIYLVPCLLPWCLATAEPDPDWREVLPALYFRFHNAKDSFHAAQLDTAPLDLFLPFAFFQRLVCRCSKQQGWSFTSNKYQNKMTFQIEDKIVILETHFQSVWIKLSILGHVTEESGFLCNVASEVYSTVTKQMNALIECYHSNMWYEVCLSPCENKQNQSKVKKQSSPAVLDVDGCLRSTGVSSMSPDVSRKPVQCKLHKSILLFKHYEAWFKPSLSPPTEPSGVATPQTQLSDIVMIGKYRFNVLFYIL